ncbi:MAG: glycosyltransferase family 2 protein [Candidatus Omnitrophota bacterium]
MDISIVIPTYEGIATLKKCLRMLRRQQADDTIFSYEIIVVIDKKDRRTEEWFSKEGRRYPQLQIIRAQGAGVNSARNKGIEESQGEIIFFLDDDCVPPHKTWLNEVFSVFCLYPDADVIGGGYRCRERKDILAISRNKLDAFYVQCNRNSSGETAVLLGGDCGYRRKIFEKCGAFDETIHYGSAEKEMHDRIRKKGIKMLYCEKLSVFHSTPKKNIIVYFNKSFKQGAGQGYSTMRNGSLSLPAGCVNQRFWFIVIARECEGRLMGKSLTSLFLLGNAFFYHMGKMYGVFKCAIKESLFNRTLKFIRAGNFLWKS